MIYPWPESTPIFLTEKGREEVEKSAQELKNKEIDIIYASDVTRAHQTAEIVAKEIGKEIIFDTRLRDINHGIFNGRPQEEYILFFSEPKEKLYKRPLQGESWNDVTQRMLSFLKEIDGEYRNQTILIVSHKGPLWLLEAALRGLGEQEILKLKEKGLPTGHFRELENNL